MLMQRNKALNMSTSMLTVSTSQTNLFRDELEDKFFRLKDEHMELKKEANNAEYQMKFLNAKLSRLINEKKRLLNKEKTRREIDLEELIFDSQQKLVQLDKENERLREKTLVLRTQLDAEMSKRSLSNTYSHIQSRTDSGLGTNFKPLNTRSSSALVLNRRPTTTESHTKVLTNPHYSKHKTTTSSSMPLFAFNLLQEAQEEIKKLEEVVAMQQSHIESLHFQSQRFKKANHMENSLVNTSTSLKSTIDMTDVTQVNGSNSYSQTEKTLKKHNQLFNHYSSGKRISDDINNMIEKLQTELSIERSKCAELRRKLVEENAVHNGRIELEQRIQALEKENDILKNSLEQCIGSCMTEIKENSRERQITSDGECERELQMQISDLKSQLLRVQNELHSEKSKYGILYNKHQQLQTICTQLRQQLQQFTTTTNKDLNKDFDKDPIDSSGRECNRRDHLELTQQLEDMQTERRQLLTEFEDMKEMLQLIQNSITDEQ